MLVRLSRLAVRSLLNGYYDFAANAVSSAIDLLKLTIKDVFLKKHRVQCNICGWTGNFFYRDTGQGYDDPYTLCPSCLCIDRHRALLIILQMRTDFFSGGKKIVEVAPERTLEKLFLSHKLNYTSFDLERHAMEQGDITNMRYGAESVDFFLCSHVLEHIPDENRAMSEIQRVLAPNGCAIIQVPIDENLTETYEYPEPNPRQMHHVRQYGRDFAQRMACHGFEVTHLRISDCLSKEQIEHFGCSMEPIFFLRKQPARI
jgi:SAM-dependent methyltransferase